jgi:hypothetical protein
MNIRLEHAFASLLAVSIGFANAAFAGDDCADVKSNLMKEWAVVVVGDNCQHLAPGPVLLDPGANTDGFFQCGKLADSGGVAYNALLPNCLFGNACYGSRAVANWDGGPSEGKPTVPKADTYVGFCVSDKVTTANDAPKVSSLKKLIDDVKGRLKK